MFRIRLSIYIFFLTLYFSINSAWGQDLFNFDSLRTSIIDPVIAADIGVADINNDGIHDLILSGYDDLNRSGLFLEIYNGNSEFDCPKSEKLERRTVSLPMNEKLSFYQTEYIIDKVKENL